MLAILAALCLAGTPVQGKTLLQQVVPNPTGKNGYEEYLRAADLVNNSESRLYLEWVPGKSMEIEARSRETEPVSGERVNADAAALVPLAKRFEAMSVLAVRREAVAKYGHALELVRQGNLKPVYDPRAKLDFETLLPEISVFRSLTRLALASAAVRDADGQGLQATDTLIDALTLADRTSPWTLLGVLVGISQESLLLATFQERLPRLSQVEAKRVASFVGERLAWPLSLKSALAREATMMLQEVDTMLTRPEGGFLGAAAQDQALASQLKALSPTDTAALAKRLRATLVTQYENLVAPFDGPESTWVGQSDWDPPKSSPIPSDLSEVIASMVVPRYDSMAVAALRSRAQLRLLRLACRVVAFQWEHGHLPPSLQDAAPADEIADPLTASVFEYVPMGDRFRVFSKGTPRTGEIDLKYEQPRRGAPPPP